MVNGQKSRPKAGPPPAEKVKGFSLLELLVVVGVFTAVSTILLVSYSTFSSRVALDALAEEVALAVREAQVRGTSAAETEIGSGAFAAYGVNFTEPAGPAPITSFALFADVDPPSGDGIYSDPASELVEEFNVRGGYFIGALEGCASSGCTALTELNIVFERPELKAIFTTTPAGAHDSVAVTVASARGSARQTVTVRTNGQIVIGPTTGVSLPFTAFSDSFEIGEWNGLWFEDAQDDWRRRSAKSSEGSYAAEIDGSTTDSTLTSIPVDLNGNTNATITFDWYIESKLDAGEYLAFDVSTDGGSTWVEMKTLQGNIDPENVWHSESVVLAGITELQVRFRGKMSNGGEDAYVDNVSISSN